MVFFIFYFSLFFNSVVELSIFITSNRLCFFLTVKELDDELWPLHIPHVCMCTFDLSISATVLSDDEIIVDRSLSSSVTCFFSFHMLGLVNEIFD